MKKGKIMMAVCSILAIICIVYGIFLSGQQAQELHFYGVDPGWYLPAYCGNPAAKRCAAETSMYMAHRVWRSAGSRRDPFSLLWKG